MEGSYYGFQWELVRREVLELLGLRIGAPTRSSGFKFGVVGRTSLVFENCSFNVFFAISFFVYYLFK